MTTVVTPEAQKQADALQAPPVEAMVRDSVPFTHPRANRRYEGFMLKVEGGRVLSVERMDVDPVRERKRARDWQRYQRSRQASDGVLDLTLDAPHVSDEAQVIGPRSRY